MQPRLKSLQCGAFETRFSIFYVGRHFDDFLVPSNLLEGILKLIPLLKSIFLWKLLNYSFFILDTIWTNFFLDHFQFLFNISEANFEHSSFDLTLCNEQIFENHFLKFLSWAAFRRLLFFEQFSFPLRKFKFISPFQSVFLWKL